jgi:2-polyprenyl-3-methyl-5-hydroxy-6-metoxy-1,4-benzoquinol methylase
MYMTGIFNEDGKKVEQAPITYGICSNCGLHQLLHRYEQKVLYGETYGYESHLNSQMREHLQQKARLLERCYLKSSSPRVLDIASNDGTFLNFFSSRIVKYGMDPLITSLNDFYPHDAIKIADFFSAEALLANTNGQLFDLVTSNSVLYDLESPLDFAKDVFSVLKENGIWHFEQSYLPTMLGTMSIDTICHEHLLYLGAHQIKAILDEANFDILEVSLNEVNGGSISVTAIKKQRQSRSIFFQFLLEKENADNLLSEDTARTFFQDALVFRDRFNNLVENYLDSGTRVFGIGASTKGNMLLQFCGLDSNKVFEIGEINPKKFGKQTPGSAIPISDEKALFTRMAQKNSVGIVFPWHFRNSIRASASQYISDGGALLYPLPKIEIESI